MCGEKTAYL